MTGGIGAGKTLYRPVIPDEIFKMMPESKKALRGFFI